MPRQDSFQYVIVDAHPVLEMLYAFEPVWVSIHPSASHIYIILMHKSSAFEYA